MKVLVVDDHAYNRELLGFMLEDDGHSVEYSKDGVDACNKVDSDSDIALVLMDVMMPVMDGLDATRKIKSSIEDRFLPILFVTALDNEKNITDCLEAGGDDFLPKPINENILLAKVKAHSRSKVLYDKLQEANDELTYHRKMIDREHSIVEHIFKNGSARAGTSCDNVKTYTSPMSMFNGDLVLLSPSPSGGVYGLIGDFTGHGLAASMGSLPVTEVFFNNVNKQASVSQLAQDINHRLKILLPQNMFFCAAIFELDRQGENMTLWMGGMNDLFALRKSDAELDTIESSHMPLGILTTEEFDDSPQLVEVAQYSQLFIYTDGITEAQNDDKEEFGDRRLADLILKQADKPIEAIVEAVNDFSSHSEQSDDVSILQIIPGKLVHRSLETGELIDVGADYHMVESIPWRLHVELKDNDLKTTNVVDQVMSFVSSIQGIELHQDKIFTIVSELYNNSLEHGVLRLDSALKDDADGFERYYELRQQRLDALNEQRIEINFTYVNGEPNKVVLEIEDTGDGFNIDSVVKNAEKDENSHGRGMKLLRHMCASIDYSCGGRKVTAVYEFREH